MNRMTGGRHHAFPSTIGTVSVLWSCGLAIVAVGVGCGSGAPQLCEIGIGEPTADAGANRNVQMGSEVILSGAASTDPNGDDLTYQWEITNGPNVEIINPNGVGASFVPSEEGLYMFALTVSDGCNSDTATVQVSVGETGPLGCPVANTGLDRTVNEGRSICINGDHSSDPGGSPLSYEWTKLSGPDVDLGNPFVSELCMSVTDVCGDQELTFELVVTNDQACRDADEVVITVRDVDGNCCESDADCDDGRPCTTDTCGPSSGACQFVQRSCPGAGTCDERTGECTTDAPHPAPECDAQTVAATFEDSAEGWIYVNAQSGGGSPGWSASSGNPGGHISAEDKGGKFFFWQAPLEFITQVCDVHYGGLFSFQLMENKNGQTTSNRHDVLLQGGGVQLYYDLPIYPGTSWREYGIRLDDQGGLKNELTDFAATEQEIRMLLNNLALLQIRGEFRKDLSIGMLDNVVITPPPDAIPSSEEDDESGDDGPDNGDDSSPDDDPDDTICLNSCEFASDGACDDGGPGSEYDICDLGSDCDDCGPRGDEDHSGGGCIDTHNLVLHVLQLKPRTNWGFVAAFYHETTLEWDRVLCPMDLQDEFAVGVDGFDGITFSSPCGKPVVSSFKIHASTNAASFMPMPTERHSSR